MTIYKHTQIGYLMISITLVVLALFAWLQITARAESPSHDSGANFVMTALMACMVLVLASFSTLMVHIDECVLEIRFGWGIFRKQFVLAEIATVKKVRNRWYYGWGIRWWLWPQMWVYNVSGLDAVELTMTNGKVYRIGTDEPEQLESAIRSRT